MRSGQAELRTGVMGFLIAVGGCLAGWGCSGSTEESNPKCSSDEQCPGELHCATQQGVCVVCLQDDHCPVSGKCDLQRNVCLDPEPQCIEDADCTSPSACKTARCDKQVCILLDAADDIPCNDQVACTVDDVCLGCDRGVCLMS